MTLGGFTFIQGCKHLYQSKLWIAHYTNTGCCIIEAFQKQKQHSVKLLILVSLYMPSLHKGGGGGGPCNVVKVDQWSVDVTERSEVGVHDLISQTGIGYLQGYNEVCSTYHFI